MSRPDRHSNRRTLGFENLEAKKSPTSLVGLGAPIDSANDRVAEVSALGSNSGASTSQPGNSDSGNLQSRKANLFLSYVATIEDIDVARALPSQVEATAVDHWLATNLPPAD